MASSYFPKVVTSGLVMYLDAGNSNSYPRSGATWYDLSGTGNDSSQVNSPTYSTTNCGIITYNGTNQYTQLTSNSTVSTTSGTASVWFKYTSAGGNGSVVIGKHDATSSFNGWAITVSSTSNFISAFIKNASSNYSYGGAVFSTAANTWYNAAITFASNSSLILYLNGVAGSPVATGVLTNNTGQPLLLANSPDVYWSIMGGSVANAMYYNRVLTPSEITQNFNAHRGRFGV